MRVAGFLGVTLVAAMLAGCVTTRTTEVAPNVVHLNTQASGLLFQGQAGPETLRKAAEATAARGFQCFKFADVASGQSREFAGIQTSSQANVYGGYRSASVYGSSIATPIYRETEQVGATVLMSNTCDASSWKAAEVLARKN